MSAAQRNLAMRLRAALRSGTADASCAIPYAEFLGISFERDGAELRGRLAFSERLIGNPSLPALHGGTVGALLEATAACTLIAASDTEQLPKIISITVQYLRSGKPRDTFAKSAITRRGRRVVALRSEAWQEDPARLIATADVHFLVAPPR